MSDEQKYKFGTWYPIETAPKGGGAEMTTDPAYVEPPKILLHFSKAIAIAYWDWYYAEGGSGFDGTGFAWVLSDSGELAPLCLDQPTHWMPLPPGPEAFDGEPETVLDPAHEATMARLDRIETLLGGLPTRKVGKTDLGGLVRLEQAIRKEIEGFRSVSEYSAATNNIETYAEVNGHLHVLLRILKEAGLE